MKKKLLFSVLLSFAVMPNVIAHADACPVEMDGNCYNHINDAFNAVLDDGTKASIRVNQDLVDEDGIGLFRTGASRPTTGTYENANQKNIDLDLNGHTVTFGDKLVGSGDKYASQNIHLEKGNTVRIVNGTFVASSTASLMFQNYSNLTLDNVTIDGRNQIPYYTLSNCNGKIELVGNTNIWAPKGSFAFDVDYQGSYPDGVTVMLDTTGTIKGNIEVDTNSKAQLVVKKANIEGEIQGGNGTNITIEEASYEGSATVSVAEGSVSYHNDTTGMEVVVPKDELIVKAFDVVATPTEEETAKANEVLENGFVIGKYYDITAWLVNPDDKNAKVEQVTENPGSVNVTLTIPNDLPALQEGYTRIYKVIRIHNGIATVFGVVDNEDGTITFITDAFSTYVLTYADQAPAADPVNTNEDNTNIVNETTTTLEEKTSNPSTADKIILYLSALVVSAVVVTGTALYLNKRY